ncbi:MAG: hypothetical protein JNL70_19335 [Saprospiraceae bacterium]|nr:hypothetical protein [Saprospiraceae bacterium]
MEKKFWILCFLTLMISCKESFKKGIVTSPDFKSEFELDSTVELQNVRDAAYGYLFSYPTSFKEQIDTADNIVFYSIDKKAKLMCFVEGNVAVADSLTNYLFEYYQNVNKGNHPYIKGSKSIKKQLIYNNLWNNKGEFTILGQSDTTEFIWKTELSEFPISGDLIFKNMLFTYPILERSKYQAIGIEMAKEFGNQFTRLKRE